MKIEIPLIALMIGALMFTGLFTVFMGISTEYDNVDTDLSEMVSEGGETSFYDAFARVNETKQEYDDLVEEFESDSVRPGSDVGPFLSMAIKTGKNMFSSLGIFKDLMYISAQIMGIPPDLLTGLVSIAIIIMLVSIIMLILGRTYS